MKKIGYFFYRKWHNLFMKYHYNQYEQCGDPVLKERYYVKASFHANKILHG